MSCSNPQDSATASPKAMRSSSISERRPFAPVTPQRTNRGHKSRVVSSPLTPSNSSIMSSPFTPITNVYSSASSITSPDSSVSTKVGFSPESVKSKSKSVADATHNWRSRAKENGIKVDNDDYPFIDPMSPKDSVPSSFFSTHRRSRQALFQASSTDGTAFISPKTARIAIDGSASAPVSSGLNSSLLSTPEAVRSLSGSFTLTTPSPRSSHEIVQKLRQRGSLTDPARPRRRHISGPILGETLFDIDEDEAMSGPYPNVFGSPLQLKDDEETFAMKSKRCVSAPFLAARFFEGFGDDDDDESFEDDGLPDGPKFSRMSIKSTEIIQTKRDKSCSVCSASSPPLSVLIPCEHLICSSCLTGALNIVGEKDMRCGTCEKPVENFKLLSPLKLGAPLEDKAEGEGNTIPEDLLPSAFEDLSLKSNNRSRETNHTSPKSHETLLNATYGDVAVLRIDNVPWDITPPALVEFLQPYNVIRAHVLLDPKGKTLSHAYVEVPATDARSALRGVQNKSLGKGKRLRGVTVTMSGQAELMRSLFPSWLGGFEGSHPTLDGLDRPSMVRTLENGLITLPEIDGLVALMKNPKSHFLKVPTLPFYSLVSILSKFPAEGDSRVFWNAKLRDLLFGLANAACDLLIERIDTDLHDQRVLEAVVSAAIDCRVFMESQRQGLYDRVVEAVSVKGGRLNCMPPDFLRPSSSGMSRSSDEVPTPDDTSSVSTASARDGRDQRSLGYGKPSKMRRNENINPFAYSNAMSLSRMPQNNYNGLLPHMQVSSSLGFQNVNIPIGLPYSMAIPSQNPYDSIAREFNVEPDLVQALAQRLSFTNQNSINPVLAGFGFGNGRI